MTKSIFKEDELVEKPTPQKVTPGPFTWTLDRYHLAITTGVLNEDDEVELLFGQLVARVPVGEPYAQCLRILNTYFVIRHGDKYYCQVQDPVTLPPNSEPQPDYAIVTRKRYSKKTGHPGPDDIHLIVEVASSSLPLDRQFKAVAYAKSGINEYWIINLKSRTLEVYLRPDISTGDYTSITHYAAGTTFESPFNGTTVVDDLLPEQDEEE
jgi:Uma2 family endonuclease